MNYFPIQQNWRRLGPIYRSEEATTIWYPEMLAYQATRMELLNVTYAFPEFSPSLRPSSFESCDWRWNRCKPGRHPAFWDYFCNAACHWTANLGLFVAMAANPERPWRIVQSNLHTTVWDGDSTLWDAQFLALNATPEDAWELAAEQSDSEIAEVGEYRLHDCDVPELDTDSQLLSCVST